MRIASGLWRRPVWIGTALLLVCVLVEGVPAARVWTVGQVPAFALLDGIRMPGPVPAVGLPLGTDVAWGQWVAELIGGLCVPAVFAAWMSRCHTRVLSVLGHAWVATLVAVVVGCLVRAVLGSLLLPGGFTSFLLLVGGTLLIGAVAGVVVGIPVGIVCGAVAASSAGDVGRARPAE